MTPAEAALVLAKASSFDSRTVGRSDAEAWAESLAGLDVERCIAAVVKHYSETTDRVMPAHVRRLTRTATDITRGVTAAGGTAEDGTALCGACKGVHRPAESCDVLKADDARWRRALSMGRSMPRISQREMAANGGERPAAIGQAPEVSPAEAARLEAERARQMAALAAMSPDRAPSAGDAR